MASLRYHLAVIAAKCSAKLIRMLGRNASHNPGVVALKICPKILSLAPKAPLVICVTGTNGKTTVSNLLTDALLADGRKVVSNRTGSNIVPGCTTNLINSLNWMGKCRVDAAVYEVDERASRLILPYLKPDYLVVTNLFRDSLKRNAHPDYIFSVINTYCPDTTKLIIAQRVSSVQDADRIIILEDGKINGFGTHEELLKTNTIYREIYESQTRKEGA